MVVVFHTPFSRRVALDRKIIFYITVSTADVEFVSVAECRAYRRIFPVETFYVFYIGGWVLEALVGRLYLGVEKVIDV